MLKNIKNFVIWSCVVLPSIVLAGSAETTQSLSDNTALSDIVLIITLIGGLLTIITVAKGKQSKKSDDEEEDFVKIKDELKQDYKELGEKISDITKFDAASKIRGLEESVTDLDEKVNNYLMKKVYTLSEHFTVLEDRVSNIDKYFDKADADRKSDTKQLKDDINTLRENIREDINDVKGIIMKLMMALKTDDD